MNKTLADLLDEQAHKLNGFVYCNFPYSCGLDEAKTYARVYSYPTDFQVTQNGSKITISIKPFKGSRKRRPIVIKLWS